MVINVMRRIINTDDDDSYDDDVKSMMIILMAKERELAEESAHDKRPKCQPIGRQLDCRWHYYDHGPWSSMVTYDDKYDDRYRVPTRVNNCGWIIN